MDQQIYICAKCGCPDLEMSKSSIIVSADQKKVRCPNCKWEGVLSETAGILTTEKIFDTKAVLNLLLFVTTKHAAGPIAQALVFIGLIEKDDQEGIDIVMRAATEGIIEKAFMAAAEHAAKKGSLGEKPDDIQEQVKNLDSKIIIEELGDGPPKMIGMVHIPQIALEELEALQKALDTPITGPIIVSQDTARELGISADNHVSVEEDLT
jgi:hypothetical protein